MKVGDYVRTLDGIKKIAKYEYRPEYENCHCIYFEDEECGWLFTDKDLLKSSHNIIDLIEAGDYVNGNKIIKICNDFAGRKILVYGYDDGERQVAITIYEEDIKSIVTKEQFESMEYKL